MLSLDEEDPDAGLLGDEAKAGKLRMRLLDGNVDNSSRPSRASDLESQRLLSLGHGGSLKDRLALVTGLSEYLTFIGVLSPTVEELTCTINTKLLAFCWTRLLRMGLLISVIIPCINMISLAVAVGPGQFHLSDVFDCVIYLGIYLIPVIALLPSLGYLHDRLNARCSEDTCDDEIDLFRSIWPYTRPYLAVFVFSSLLYLLLLIIFAFLHLADSQAALSFAELQVERALMMFSGISTACFLLANLLFITVDARICRARISDLQALAEQKQLTVQKYEQVRAEVERRTQPSFRINSGIVLVAISNVIIFILAVLFPSAIQYGKSITGRTLYLSYLLVLCKELVFLAIVFQETAAVNEAADALTSFLALTSFVHDKTESGPNRGSDAAIDGPVGRGREPEQDAGDVKEGEGKEEMPSSALRQEMRRLVVWANAQQRPISFPLWYLRLKNRDVLAQFGTFVLTTVVVLLRTLILARET